MLPFTLNRLTISLQPSLEKFESQLLQLINVDCHNTVRPDFWNTCTVLMEHSHNAYEQEHSSPRVLCNHYQSAFGNCSHSVGSVGFQLLVHIKTSLFHCEKSTPQTGWMGIWNKYASIANKSRLTQTQFWFPLHPLYGGSSLHSNKDGCDGLDTNLSQDFSLQLDAFLYRTVCLFSVQTQAHLQLPMRFKAHHLQSSIELISSLPFFLSVESQTLNHVWQVRLWPSNYLYSGFAWALSVRFSLSEMCHW